MSEGPDWQSVGIGALITGSVGLLIAFIRGLFTRTITTEDTNRGEMKSDIKEILMELRSMHDEQLRQRGDLINLVKETEFNRKSIESAHKRIDALIAPSPIRSER